jgi:precorrin-2/cobalt-factor-2 C20-methyltransferase
MTGTLYVIGVGPGDPELLTLKAVRILREVQCICVPKGRQEGSSMALNIVKKVVNMDKKEIIEAHFPMKKTKASVHASELDTRWNETVETVLSILNRGTDMAFITIGDPTIYSTFFYLYDRLLELSPLLPVEMVPGISSITASASRAKISLGLADEKIAVLPATYAHDISTVLEHFDTVVLMKVHNVFDRILSMLDAAGLTGKSVFISRAGMSDEEVVRDISELRGKDLSYFSMVIIKK